jgi:serine phosphatase RsbU (regulator of sigma subunit)
MTAAAALAAPPKSAEAAARAGDLPFLTASLTPAATNDEVMQLFSAQPGLHGLAVVERGQPIGLINRNDFFSYFARPFHRDLFLQKSCVVLMNDRPAIVDQEATIAEVGAVVSAAGPKGLSDGVVITENGRYRGLCEGLAVMRAMTALQTHQHAQLLSSIEYASTIQSALLADSRAALRAGFGEGHALIWEPRDVVGGDCFFAVRDERGVLFGLIDCTGHGVPGALLTSIAISETNRLTARPELRSDPSALLGELNRRMKAALNQETEDGASQADDGMDAVFLWAEAGAPALRAASAKLPIFVMRPGAEVEHVKGARRGLGYRDTPADQQWPEIVIPAGDGARIFLATDGVGDQIGQARPMGFGWSRFAAALSEAAAAPIGAQTAFAHERLQQWQGAEARRDDVSILGVELGQHRA